MYSAHYVYRMFSTPCPVVAIIDLDRGGRSVTNDAENVIRDFRTRGVDVAAHRFIYRDSMGQWDQLLIGPGGGFAGFAPLRPDDVGMALHRCIAEFEQDTL